MTKVERNLLYKAAQALVDTYSNQANPGRPPYVVVKVRRTTLKGWLAYKISYERKSELADIASIFGGEKSKPLSMVFYARDIQEEIEKL